MVIILVELIILGKCFFPKIHELKQHVKMVYFISNGFMIKLMNV